MKNVMLVISLFLLLFIIIVTVYDGPEGKWYNCRDVDFLPDVPPQVRQECRKIIKERLEEQKKLQDSKLIHT